TTADGIYVLHGTNCLRLDIATGKTLNTFPLPAPGRGKPTAVGGYINVWKDYLIVGVSDPDRGSKPRTASTGSQRSAVPDRNSGRMRWSVTARIGFRNNAICVGNGRLFAVDRPGSDLFDFDARRGETSSAKPRLLALDLATGRKRWSTEKDIFGTWLSYSA